MKKILVIIMFLAPFSANADEASDMIEVRMNTLEDSFAPLTSKLEEVDKTSRESIESLTKSVKDLQLQVKEIHDELDSIKPAAQPKIKEPKQDLLLPVNKNDDDAAFYKGAAMFDEGKYPEAEAQFKANLQAFAGGARFNDNLLYLGLTLSAAGKRTDACKTFKTLIDSNEVLDGTLQKRVEQEYDRTECD